MPNFERRSHNVGGSTSALTTLSNNVTSIATPSSSTSSSPRSNRSSRTKLSANREKTRPLTVVETALNQFGSTEVVDRASAVAIQAQRIVTKTPQKHLPTIRKNYRSQTRALLASLDSTNVVAPNSDDRKQENRANQLKLALQQATLAYHLSLHLHNHDYFHLSLLPDYILLVKVCSEFPKNSQQHKDAIVLLERCKTIVASNKLSQHSDQDKSCAAQPIVAALLEQWGNPEAAAQLPRELFEEQAKRRVVVGLLLGEVIKSEELKADDEKVKAIIEEMATAYEDPSEVIAYYEQNQQMMDNMRNVALEEQAIDAIIAKAQVSEKEVSFNELMNQQPAA